MFRVQPNVENIPCVTNLLFPSKAHWMTNSSFVDTRSLFITMIHKRSIFEVKYHIIQYRILFVDILDLEEKRVSAMCFYESVWLVLNIFSSPN